MIYFLKICIFVLEESSLLENIFYNSPQDKDDDLLNAGF